MTILVLRVIYEVKKYLLNDRIEVRMFIRESGSHCVGLDPGKSLNCPHLLICVVRQFNI